VPATSQKRGKNAKGNDTIPREIGRGKAHGQQNKPIRGTRSVHKSPSDAPKTGEILRRSFRKTTSIKVHPAAQ
jgi:hypothetical protein